MVSPELIRRYPFFACLTHEQLIAIAKVATDQSFPAGHRFFQEGDPLKEFYLLIEGAVGIVIPVTNSDISQDVSVQLTGGLETKDITVSTVGTGDIFGWSALIPPTNATAGAVAVTRCRTLAFDCKALRASFKEDASFALLMTQKAAQVIRERLRDMRIESLSIKEAWALEAA